MRSELIEGRSTVTLTSIIFVSRSFGRLIWIFRLRLTRSRYVWHNSKRSYEFLKECKLSNSKNPIARQEDKKKIALAEQIRNKRALQLQSGEYDILPSFRQDIDFLAYFQAYLDKYKKKDARLLAACFNKFKQYLQESNISSINARQLNEAIVEDFKDGRYS